ncbi:histidine phosphatase family protein [Paenibacillus jiagnxiensis]|uniref:histidine phosphatase family protein n=1 Tax=Paenibacillus jiagnxiensis TaxID=3228926 RepID=UPI0033AB2382
MLLGLIRHGLTDWNVLGRIQGQSDIPLNEEGRKQARLLGARLQQESYQWDAVVTSGLSRARETGEIIASMLGIELLEPDVRLNERSFGQVEGLTQAERESRWGADWHLLELGQENEEAMRQRGLEFLKAVWEENRDRNLLVVSHGAFLAQLFTALYEDKHTERIGNLSLTILERQDIEWSPVLYNCTKHLL